MIMGKEWIIQLIPESYIWRYHSGKILFGVINGLAIIWLSLLPKISGSQ